MAYQNCFNFQSNQLTNKTCGGCSNRKGFNGRNTHKGMPYKNQQIVIDLGSCNVFNPCVAQNRQVFQDQCGQHHQSGSQSQQLFGKEVSVACGNSYNNVDEIHDLSVGNDYQCPCQCEPNLMMGGAGSCASGQQNLSGRNFNCHKPFHCDCGVCRHCREYAYVKNISKHKEAPAYLANKKNTFTAQATRRPVKYPRRENAADNCFMECMQMINDDCVIGGPLITEYRDKYRYYPDPQKWVEAREKRVKMNIKTYGPDGKSLKTNTVGSRPEWKISLKLSVPKYEPSITAAEAKLKVLEELIHGPPVKLVKQNSKRRSKAMQASTKVNKSLKKSLDSSSSSSSEDESDEKTKRQDKSKPAAVLIAGKSK